MAKKKVVDKIEELLSEGLVKRGNDISFVFRRIPFGIPSLDLLVGGGIPQKRITLLMGQSNAGKSYLASQVVKSTQQNGGTAAWIDSEWSWDMDWMKKCGINTETILLSQPENGEQAFDILRALMQNSIDVIVLDSIAGLAPIAIHDENFSYNPMAWQARFVNQSLPRLVPHLKNGSAVILINQVRSSMGPVSLDAMPGGLGQTFFSHLILQVRRSGWIEENEIKVGFDMEVRCRKSKAGGQVYQACTVPFRTEGGIDLLETYIREFLDKDLIKRAGPWYSIGEEKVMGLNGVRKFLLENPEKFDEMKKYA